VPHATKAGKLGWPDPNAGAVIFVVNGGSFVCNSARVNFVLF